jgi:hypothetical protein
MPDQSDNGARSAFPQGLTVGQNVAGLTKRELIAAICLQGILANKAIGKLTLWSTAQSAVMYADQLIDCLDRDVRDDARLERPESPPLDPEPVQPGD